MNSHTEHSGEHNHEEHSNSLGHKLLLGGGIGTAAVVSAPYIGNFFGVGKSVMDVMMPAAPALSFHLPSGLALAANNFLSGVPVVGSALAAGGIEAAAISGVIGIGGMLLGNHIQKKYDADSQIPWGKIIKYTCLATSMLIALPSLLTGISVGLSYLAGFTPYAATVSDFLVGTLGSMGMSHGAASGVMGMGSLLTHFFTCGGAALSAVGAAFLDKNESKTHNKHSGQHTEHSAQNSQVSPPNLTMKIANCSPIISGQECQISFRLTDENGKVLSADDLRETHTKKLHVMIVDDSLTDYHHIHPEYDEKTSCFVANFTPQIQNGYSAWHDFQLQTGASFVLKNQLPVARDYHIPPAILHSNFASAAGFNMEIIANPPLQSGQNSTLILSISDAYGNPAKFEEIMGASGHLVAFSKDKKDYIHCHPMEEISKNGELVFHVAPTHEGFGKFFLGIKVDGREATIPFGQYIQPKNRAMESVQEMPKSWEHSAHLHQHQHAQRGFA